MVDQVFGRIGSGGVGAFTLTDYQGSVIGVTDEYGTKQDQIVYDGYGNITSESSAPAIKPSSRQNVLE